MAVPETIDSRQPYCPHEHCPNDGSTTVWPISPALPFRPRSSFPSATIPDPTPVLTVIYVKSSLPCPAPIHFSASAATFASFSNVTGIENDCWTNCCIGISLHVCRLGGQVIIPFLLSNGPGAPIPMPIIS